MHVCKQTRGAAEGWETWRPGFARFGSWGRPPKTKKLKKARYFFHWKQTTKRRDSSAKTSLINLVLENLAHLPPILPIRLQELHVLVEPCENIDCPSHPIAHHQSLWAEFLCICRCFHINALSYSSPWSHARPQ